MAELYVGGSRRGKGEPSMAVPEKRKGPKGGAAVSHTPERGKGRAGRERPHVIHKTIEKKKIPAGTLKEEVFKGTGKKRAGCFLTRLWKKKGPLGWRGKKEENAVHSP